MLKVSVDWAPLGESALDLLVDKPGVVEGAALGMALGNLLDALVDYVGRTISHLFPVVPEGLEH